MALASMLTVAGISVQAGTPPFDEPLYAERRQVLLDTLDPAQALLDPHSNSYPRPWRLPWSRLSRRGMMTNRTRLAHIQRKRWPWRWEWAILGN